MAPRQRDWDALSPAYRKRLSGAGVTRSQYESGADLRKARGKAPAKVATRRPTSSAAARATGRPTPTKRTARDWNALTPAYRKRLQGAGITREQYESGADLRKARGKGFKAPTPSGFPEDSRQRVIDGQSNAEDRRNVKAWRQSRSYPSWLPRDPADLDDQTAVILSTIRPYPNATDRAGRRAGWRNVEFTHNADGTVTMTVTPIRGYPFTVTLPDNDAAAQVQSILRNLNTPGVDIDHRGEGYARPTPKSATKPVAASAPAKKSAAKIAAPPAATKKQSAKKVATKKTGTQAAKAKPATKKSPAKRTVKRSTVKRSTPRKQAAAQPLGVFDLLADTVGEAINTAGDAVDTVIDNL